MENHSTQMKKGKAFEYAILREFQEKLARYTHVETIENDALITAKNCFE